MALVPKQTSAYNISNSSTFTKSLSRYGEGLDGDSRALGPRWGTSWCSLLQAGRGLLCGLCLGNGFPLVLPYGPFGHPPDVTAPNNLGRWGCWLQFPDEETGPDQDGHGCWARRAPH